MADETEVPAGGFRLYPAAGKPLDYQVAGPDGPAAPPPLSPLTAGSGQAVTPAWNTADPPRPVPLTPPTPSSGVHRGIRVILVALVAAVMAGGVGLVGLRYLSGPHAYYEEPPVVEAYPAPDQGIDFSGQDMNGYFFDATWGMDGFDLNNAKFVDTSLIGAKFISGMSLIEADFTGARLTGANLAETIMTGANLTGATAIGADFSNTKLTGANLHGADLTGANLKDADLTGADLTGANLTGAKLGGAILEGATYDGATNFPWDFDPAGAGMTFVP